MVRLVALKRVRYPRGKQGHEYVRGDAFESLSDRDAKVFVAAGIAQMAPVSPLRVAEPTPLKRPRGRPRKHPLPVEAEPAAEYSRRDMRAVDE